MGLVVDGLRLYLRVQRAYLRLFGVDRWVIVVVVCFKQTTKEQDIQGIRVSKGMRFQTTWLKALLAKGVAKGRRVRGD